MRLAQTERVAIFLGLFGSRRSTSSRPAHRDVGGKIPFRSRETGGARANQSTTHQQFVSLHQPISALCDDQAAMTLLRFGLALIACLLLTAHSTSAVTLRGQVGTNHVLREFFYVGPAANVIAYSLNSTEGTQPTKYSSFIKRDGAFLLELPDPVATSEPDSGETASVPPSKSDVYLLKFHVRALQFDQYRVDVRPAKKSGQQPVVSIRPHNP